MKWAFDAAIIAVCLVLAAILPLIGLGIGATVAALGVGYNHGQDNRGPKRLTR